MHDVALVDVDVREVAGDLREETRLGIRLRVAGQLHASAERRGADLRHLHPWPLGGEALAPVRLLREGAAVSTGYARLLGTGDEFVAEVPLGSDGGFRFFAAPGSWTLRVLAPGGLRAERAVQADYGQVTTVDVAI